MPLPTYVADSVADFRRLVKEGCSWQDGVGEKQRFLQIYPLTDVSVKALAELAYNSLFNPDVKFSPKAKQALSKYRTDYSRLADVKVSLHVKKQLIQRRGHLFAFTLVRFMLQYVNRFHS